MTRRAVLVGAGAVAAGAAAGAIQWLRQPELDTGVPVQLRAEKSTLYVDGRPGAVMRLVSATGSLNQNGLVMREGERFLWRQDGVPNVSAPALQPGKSVRYDFTVAPSGTHWMHSHVGLQEQIFLSAPLIVRKAEDHRAGEQEVVMMLHDFSFTPPEELMAKLTGGAPMPGAGHASHAMPMAPSAPMPAMNHARMDVNDIDYDAYLASERTLNDPHVVTVEKEGQVRLRIINAAAATNYTIDLGDVEGELIAVDGDLVQPILGHRFPIAIAQRIDIRLRIPPDSAVPVLALREGAPERTGIILAPPGAEVRKIDPVAEDEGPLLNLGLERQLRAVSGFAPRAADRRIEMDLTGDMAAYQWGIDLKGAALEVKQGERVELAMRNVSGMTHPMHLHGHHFQVVEINGARFEGARRDTVYLPADTQVTVAFDAVNPGLWAFHCHHLYHMERGIFAVLKYQGVG
ncbi:MAG: multicopper oxidase domain-containing protein [Alphaproteobacteria bacterium]|nr:multicopper oxidase domain-containing protein [Alphaproteobacteria bacterium]